MLPKKSRLVKDYEIKKAYFSKYRIKTDLFQIYIRKTENPDFQLLVVISKKVLKKATKRNRLRRKIQAIFEFLKFSKRLPTKISCIIQVKSEASLKLKPEDLKQAILPEITTLYQKTLTKS